MPLQIAHDLAGVEAKTASALEDIIAALQTWANQVDGINAAERLTQLTTGIASLPTVPTGAVLAWSAPAVPTGYVLCDGRAISRADFVTLYTLIGLTYGIGDGATTFNVPDLRQRFILGVAASGTGTGLGASGGSIDHTHSGASHTHSISGGGSHNHGGATGTPSSGVAIGHTTTPINADVNGDGATVAVGGFASGNVIDDGVQTHPIGSDGSHDHGGATGSGGSGSTGSANPPFYALYYVIKA